VKDQSFFAVCPSGLEQVLEGELRAAGAEAIRSENGGVAFSGTLRTAYAVNLHSRIASRVLWQVGRRGYTNEQHLYDATQEVRWQDLMTPQQTLRVDVTASRSPLRSLEFAMLRVKDGIVDRMRNLTGERPSIERAQPDVRVFERTSDLLRYLRQLKAQELAAHDAQGTTAEHSG
jgi:putative N6-adenine-specific DNA methylase